MSDKRELVFIDAHAYSVPYQVADALEAKDAEIARLRLSLAGAKGCVSQQHEDIKRLRDALERWHKRGSMAEGGYIQMTTDEYFGVGRLLYGGTEDTDND